MARGTGPFGGDEDTARLSAEEAATPFVHNVSPDTYVAVHDEVLRRWNYRCAMTGVQFIAAQRPHPDLEVIAIRPLAAGGPLTPANFLPLVEPAARIFERRLVIVGDNFEMWSGLARFDAELWESIIPLGGLLVPNDPVLWPDREQLRWHREQVLAPKALEGPEPSA